MNPAVSDEAWWGLGAPCAGGVLIVGDHASNHVPIDIDLGINTALLDLHVARDIGVAEVAQELVQRGAADTAFLAGVSRLVVDCNREEGAAGLIPAHSDGHNVPGNVLDAAERSKRVARFYHPYHAKLAQIIAAARPAMILSLHSFTPRLETSPKALRPWQIGILYNDDDRLARVAMPVLESQGLFVGDQLPYSGRDLNYTMNVHAEANGIPYLGIEMRQDIVRSAQGVAQMAAWISVALAACRNHLAQNSANAE